MNLQISEEALGTIHQHALRDFPNECCGFLFGNEVEDRMITEAHEVINSKQGDQKRRFEISPLDYIEAEKYALQNEVSFLGIYHSHPKHPAIPSEHDRKQAVNYFSYIITSVFEDRIEDTTSWQLKSNKEFEQENIKIVKAINS